MAEHVEGQNLQAFQSLQLDFAAHIRNPELNPIPAGIEARRMAIYARLIYNNIENFCATRFKRAKELLGDAGWDSLVRDFVHRHESKSPYFSQIAEEFLAYLALERDRANDPPFLLEMCHFDWLPLYLDRLPGEIPSYQSIPEPLVATLKTSELVQVRRYEWPVHKLSAEFQPSEPPPNPTWVLAFRNRADKVDQKVVDGFTATLVERFREPVVGRIGVESVLGDAATLTRERMEKIEARLHDLIELDVLLFTDEQRAGVDKSSAS